VSYYFELSPDWLKYFDIYITIPGDQAPKQRKLYKGAFGYYHFSNKQEYVSDKFLKDTDNELFGPQAAHLYVTAYTKPESEWPKEDISSGLYFSYEAEMRLDGWFPGSYVYETLEAKDDTGLLKGEELKQFLKHQHKRFIDLYYKFPTYMWCIKSEDGR